MEKDFLLFLLANIFIGIAQSVDGSTLSNFLKEKFNFVILQRTTLEIPRELPGFLVFLTAGLLYAIGDVRMAFVSSILAATGMFFLGIIPPSFILILMFVFIYSTGQHLFMPLSSSISMSFAKKENLGRKLGSISAANTAALVFGSAVLFVLFRFFKISYTVSFSIGAAAFLLSAVMLLMMSPDRAIKVKNRFIFRKEYKVFYILSALNGARKQIFLTFAPWVLVDVFKQKVTVMTLLFFISSTLSIFVKPVFGSLIDKKGEKFVLGMDALGLLIICLGYAFAKDVMPAAWVVATICVCYVLDPIFMATGMARSTYIWKIAVHKDDVLPVLSSGISIDHIFSMFLPFLGGILWTSLGAYGYKYIFIIGAVIAFGNFVSTRFIRTERVESVQIKK